ncbi:MAG: phosphoglycolate phosphatase [Silicimonas sp.]|nr:phosphoglycolate phosphatase [Silicimonas sp.]
MTPVVFDLDGTLIDSLPDVTEAANALLSDEGLEPLPPSSVAGFVGLGERVFLDRLIATTGLDRAEYDRLMERFIGHYKTATRNTRLFPGVREALDDLRSDGVPLALCTNKPSAPLEPTLEAGGLIGVFDVVVAGDTLPSRKPDPGPLRYIMDKLSAGRCIYVGDSEVDAETAVNASVPFVLFTEGIRQLPVSEIPHTVAFSDFRTLRGIYHSLT